MTNRKIGVIVSGRGSNFQAVLDKIKAENLPAEITKLKNRAKTVRSAQFLLLAFAFKPILIHILIVMIHCLKIMPY